jgi:outer membrane protein TolC
MVILILFGPARGYGQDSLDLPQAINFALSQNRELLRSALSIDLGGLGVAGARAEFGLSVRPDGGLDFTEGGGNYGYGLRAAQKLIWGTEISLAARETSTSYNYHRDAIQVEVRQPLFRNFGSLIHGEPLLQATQNFKGAQRKVEMQKADLVIKVVEAYENILRLKLQLKAFQQSQKRMDALYRVTKAKEVLGRTTRIDTLRVEFLKGQAASQLEICREQLASLQRDFAELLGFPQEKTFELKPTPMVAPQMPEPEKAVRIALENRLDYAQVLQDYQDMVRGVRIAKRKLLPDVKLVARQEWYGDGATTSDARNFGNNTWGVGFTVDTDFNLTKSLLAVDQAQVQQTAAKQTIVITELTIAQQVHQTLLAQRRIQAELKIAEQNFKLAESRSRLARRLFALGRGENFPVTDAEEAYLLAEKQWLSAQADANMANYKLFYIMGTLVEVPKDLKPGR